MAYRNLESTSALKTALLMTHDRVSASVTIVIGAPKGKFKDNRKLCASLRYMSWASSQTECCKLLRTKTDFLYYAIQ